MTSWRSWFTQHRAILGYIFLVSVLVISLEIHHEREDRRIRQVQKVSCENTSLVIANQKLVLQNLINLRIAALASPYLRLEAQRELGILQKALKAVEAREDPCALYLQ